MASELKKRIEEDMKAALRAHEKDRLGTLRLLLAAVKQREIDERIEIDDPGVMKIIEKMIKQRHDSITHYQAGNRPDLVDKEKQEISVIKSYLPEPLSDSEIDAAIDSAIQQTGASTIKDMGKVMGILKAKLQGRADMGQVSARIKTRLHT